MNTLTWPQRVRELQASGMTYAEIAVEIKLSPSSVGDLATGRYRSPSGDSAVLLHQLHAARCKPSDSEAA